MFIFGMMWRLIYEFKELNRNSFPAVAVYAVLAIGIPIYIRGFATVVLVVSAWFVLHLIVFGWLGKTSRRAPARTLSTGDGPDMGTTPVVRPSPS